VQQNQKNNNKQQHQQGEQRQIANRKSKGKNERRTCDWAIDDDVDNDEVFVAANSCGLDDNLPPTIIT